MNEVVGYLRVFSVCPDVTLPSCLDGSSEFQEMDQDGDLQWPCHFPDSCGSSSSVLVKIYQEIMTIYKQLKVRETKKLRPE